MLVKPWYVVQKTRVCVCVLILGAGSGCFIGGHACWRSSGRQGEGTAMEDQLRSHGLRTIDRSFSRFQVNCPAPAPPTVDRQKVWHLGLSTFCVSEILSSANYQVIVIKLLKVHKLWAKLSGRHLQYGLLKWTALGS